MFRLVQSDAYTSLGTRGCTCRFNGDTLRSLPEIVVFFSPKIGVIVAIIKNCKFNLKIVQRRVLFEMFYSFLSHQSDLKH